MILHRMDNVLEQAPAASKQARERIIGERPLANSEKLLSLYERDLYVIVRGKAGAEVEPSRREASEMDCRRQPGERSRREPTSQFGNSLFVAENAEGFILHHALLRDQSPGDSQWLSQTRETLGSASGGSLWGLVADRGFVNH